MIKYLGSKRRLLAPIAAAVESLAPPRERGSVRVLDLFSGTARVSHALKARGYRMIANDSAAYAATLARGLVGTDRARWSAVAAQELERLRAVPPKAGWFTEQYCQRARYLHPDNGAKVEAVREEIARAGYPAPLEAVLLTALLLAADRVDSTVGVQMAFLKDWAPRALRPLQLSLPELLDGEGEVHEGEALAAAGKVEAEVAYLDPPYNQHCYLGNYHLWETLVRWDRPEVYGVARKRVDVRVRKSPFNSRPKAGAALAELVAAVRAPHLVVSFNDEGFLARREVEEILASRGEVKTLSLEQPRYVGARIGIHNPRGERVGRVGRLCNVEHLFLVRGKGSTAPAGALGTGAKR